jgi:hypothetical protein
MLRARSSEASMAAFSPCRWQAAGVLSKGANQALVEGSRQFRRFKAALATGSVPSAVVRLTKNGSNMLEEVSLEDIRKLLARCIKAIHPTSR